ncbi:TIGR02269 family lipoprotein [Archangium gephyra]|uniref:DUF2380 domain-containing protein n=1 Tax=Archangium gephyra TaxID=48 RepID=UPI0035D45126
MPDTARWAAWATSASRCLRAIQWTMLIPEHVHLRIHRGAGGGAWNAAWEQFRIANRHRRVPPEELLRTAFEFAFRFDIVGPLMPYSATVSPPGPQLLAP